MFLVTNREPRKMSGGPDILGKHLNPKGPHELRLVEAVRKNRKWKLQVLPDQVTKEMQEEAGASNRHVANYVAGKLLDRINPKMRSPRSRRKGRNLLVFVHGFNNDVEDVLDRAAAFERNFGVEVLPFTWPANGGGARGVISYKSDKRDAKASIGALDRVLSEVGVRMDAIIRDRVEEVEKEARQRFPDNKEKRAEFIVRNCDQGCPFTVNLLAHSMGNYLYKHLLRSTASEGKGLTFDNVILAAADTNNLDHRLWVDEIRARRRVYVTINEDDQALRVSRIKTGDEQYARLGHYPFHLNSPHAAYVQFTDAKKVGSSHAYFEGDPLENTRVKKFFHAVLNGGRGEEGLPYDARSNTYRIK